MLKLGLLAAYAVVGLCAERNIVPEYSGVSGTNGNMRQYNGGNNYDYTGGYGYGGNCKDGKCDYDCKDGKCDHHCKDGKCDNDCKDGKCDSGCKNGNCGGDCKDGHCNDDCKDGHCDSPCHDGKCPGHGGHGNHPGKYPTPGSIYQDVTDSLKGMHGLPLDGSLVPVNPNPEEDLSKITGQCKAMVNLIQVVPGGDCIDDRKFAHIKRMVHFMLDGFLLGEHYTHAGVVMTASKNLTAFSITDPAGKSNIEARKKTANLKKGHGISDMSSAIYTANEMIDADHRPKAVNVVIIHTDGEFDTGNNLFTNITNLQDVDRLIPIVVTYGDKLYKTNNELKAMVRFAECLDLEFCPNLIPTKWSAASLLSTQLAVKQYIATALRAIPSARIVHAQEHAQQQ